MKVVLLHGGDGAVGPWHRGGARAVMLIAAQLLADNGALDGELPRSSPTRPARRVLCLLAEVDLATGAGLASRSASRVVNTCAALSSLGAI